MNNTKSLFKGALVLKEFSYKCRTRRIPNDQLCSCHLLVMPLCESESSSWGFVEPTYWKNRRTSVFFIDEFKRLLLTLILKSFLKHHSVYGIFMSSSAPFSSTTVYRKSPQDFPVPKRRSNSKPSG